jgi:hypothetical protein
LVDNYAKSHLIKQLISKVSSPMHLGWLEFHCKLQVRARYWVAAAMQMMTKMTKEHKLAEASAGWL